MIIITGTGRSGTTLLAKALQHAGVEMGPMSDGYAEHLAAININRAIMKYRGIFTWGPDYPDPTAETGIREINNVALKQTDLCCTLDVWWKARQDITVIVCHRRLDAARASFVKISQPHRSDLTSSSATDFHQVSTPAWMAFAYGQLMDTLHSCQIQHVFFQFPEDLNDLDGCYTRLEPVLHPALGREKFIASMQATIDRGKIHH